MASDRDGNEARPTTARARVAAHRPAPLRGRAGAQQRPARSGRRSAGVPRPDATRGRSRRCRPPDRRRAGAARRRRRPDARSAGPSAAATASATCAASVRVPAASGAQPAGDVYVLERDRALGPRAHDLHPAIVPRGDVAQHPADRVQVEQAGQHHLRRQRGAATIVGAPLVVASTNSSPRLARLPRGVAVIKARRRHAAALTGEHAAGTAQASACSRLSTHSTAR